MLNDDELKQIRDRVDAATAGPWEWRKYGALYSDVPAGMHEVMVADDANDRGPDDADAAFIAAARTDVPKLLDEVEQLRTSERLAAEERDYWRDLADRAGRDNVAISKLRATAEAEIERLRAEVERWRVLRNDALAGRCLGVVLCTEIACGTGSDFCSTACQLRAEVKRLRIAVETLASCVYHDGQQWQFQQDATDEELRTAIGAAR